MTCEPLDLTGQWHGTYTYPRNYGPATPFLATIEDQAGSLFGSIIEPDAFHGSQETMEAAIAGHRAGRSVDFTKTYRGQQFGYENPVDYVGQLSSDGLSVSGVWSLIEHNGTFEMFREISLSAQVEDEASEEVHEALEL
ncbi:hypothetical protein [Qipengyuania marisflavi]|uniref:DUF1579 domain-containing protein n=1 Tax=Qipengyuania marisflavi TaxID=2486356 RepID=A0A5S3P084_9SPHN|nr:hypothetical protein [Qipengyuania marisflavi]TMM46227.1 hypothetical protein FEV51_11520 [Qipengyuania marisflavi]